MKIVVVNIFRKPDVTQLAKVSNVLVTALSRSIAAHVVIIPTGILAGTRARLAAGGARSLVVEARTPGVIIMLVVVLSALCSGPRSKNILIGVPKLVSVFVEPAWLLPASLRPTLPPARNS